MKLSGQILASKISEIQSDVSAKRQIIYLEMAKTINNLFILLFVQGSNSNLITGAVSLIRLFCELSRDIL